MTSEEYKVKCCLNNLNNLSGLINSLNQWYKYGNTEYTIKQSFINFRK